MKERTVSKYTLSEYATVIDIVKHKHDSDMIRFNLLMTFFRIMGERYYQR
jgi:hypothetical protein